MKYLAIFSLFLVFFSVSACDKELKEHPVSPQLKQQMAAQKEAANEGQFISGLVRIPEELSSRASEKPVLFLIARPEGTSGGPPLAAKRYSLIKFPFEYRIGQENVMLEGNRFEGKITLTARLDMDGFAKASPGDIEGTVTVSAGDEAVEIVLDRVVEATARSAAGDRIVGDRIAGDRSVSGIIRVDPALADRLPKNGALFLIARSEGVQRGMPLAVKKLTAVEFPYSFSLDQSDVMLPDASFEGPITLFARIDHDGDAAPAPGDIDGKISVTVGDKNIELILNNLIGG